ncbi:MAG TPA: hypothetical protein VGK73_36195 [Polyangiaceae bacterium]
MKRVLFGVAVSLVVPPLGCSNDPADPSPDDVPNPSGGAGGDTASEGGEGGAPPEGSAAVRQELCETICATEAELPCPPDLAACVKTWCEDQVMSFPECLAPYDVMLGCMAEEPVESYECSEGEPFPKPETCSPEQAELIACLQNLQ